MATANGCFEPYNSRLAPGNETMETNETNKTLYFLVWNQQLRMAHGVTDTEKAKKCGILPHWRGLTIRGCSLPFGGGGSPSEGPEGQMDCAPAEEPKEEELVPVGTANSA